ncbi:hypothetical protein PFLUV_G00265340 [Perca fluviatilis]|uniref:Uncharacterized protein n=1 Tax=Perca fluviatilis TaxID=8168 RepID=A0A6A5E8U7_PERFL|nr:hypothetical protein PFLUV_G00265340 [Perca fluviatilis]
MLHCKIQLTSLDSFHSCDGQQPQVLSLRDEICTLCARRKKQTTHTVKSKVVSDSSFYCPCMPGIVFFPR